MLERDLIQCANERVGEIEKYPPSYFLYWIIGIIVIIIIGLLIVHYVYYTQTKSIITQQLGQRQQLELPMQPNSPSEYDELQDEYQSDYTRSPIYSGRQEDDY